MGADGWIAVFADSLPEELVRRAEQAYAFTMFSITTRNACPVRTEAELCEELEEDLLEEVTVWT